MKTTKFNLIFSIFFLGFFLSNLPSQAQMNMMWNVESSGPPSGSFQNRYAATDSSGISYLAVTNSNFGNDTDTLYLNKFDGDGNLLWRKLVKTDNTSGSYFFDVQLYIDGLNNPVINLQFDSSSFSFNKFIKCDSSGVIQWQFNIEELSPLSVSFDNTGSLYFQIFNGNDSTMVLEKHNSSGALEYTAATHFWSGSYGRPPVLDNLGNAWFGFNLISATWDTSKFYRVNSSGIITDSLIYIGGYYGPMSFDQQNNILVGVGMQYPPNSNYTDSVKSTIMKYDHNLNLLWDTGPTELYRIDHLLVDDVGNIFGLGFYGSGPNSDSCIMKVGKFDPSGNISFINSFGTNSAGLSNYAYGDLHLDDSGNPIVIGRYYPNGYSVSTNSNEFFIRRLDNNGTLLDFDTYLDVSGVVVQQSKIILNNLFSYVSAKLYRFCFDCTPTLTGKVYFDLDNNCALNGNEHGLPNAIVNVMPGNRNFRTDSTGNYRAFLADNNYDVLFTPYLGYSAACNVSSLNVQISNGIPVNQVDGGKYLSVTNHDMELFQSHGAIRSGFNVSYAMTYLNAGGSEQNGFLELILDSIFDFDQSIPPPDFNSGDTLRWNFALLPQGLSNQINMVLNTDFSAPIGTYYQNQMVVYGLTPEATPGNNVILDSGLVTGSFDPNIKIAEPAGVGPQGLISASDTAIQYTIHFENLGNDTAFTVLVIDTLDMNLDISTFLPVASSHPYTWELRNPGIIWFRFDNILLADSSDPDNNKGFISYRINQMPGLQAGNVISNTADIYFDFNLPIRTNTTVHTITNFVGIKEPGELMDISILPNPAIDHVIINYTGGTGKSRLKLFNMLGELVMDETVENRHIVVDLSNRNSGIYFIRLEDDHYVATGKLIKL